MATETDLYRPMRIFIGAGFGNGQGIYVDKGPHGKDTEYIRFDLHEEEVAKLKMDIMSWQAACKVTEDEHQKLTKERDDAKDVEEKLSKLCVTLQKERDELVAKENINGGIIKGLSEETVELCRRLANYE